LNDYLSQRNGVEFGGNKVRDDALTCFHADLTCRTGVDSSPNIWIRSVCGTTDETVDRHESAERPADFGVYRRDL